MKKKEYFVNYILTICFILLVVLFLISMIGISRVTLNESPQVRDHVGNAKELLDQIENNHNEIDSLSQTGIGSFGNGIYSPSFSIEDVSHLNIREDRAFITFRIDSQIKQEKNIYYVEIKDFKELSQGDLILLSDQETFEKAEFLSLEEDHILAYDKQNNKIEQIDFENIKGVIVYIKND